MAKFVKEYHIHVGDLVRFYLGNGVMQQGVVQDISQMPDIYVEGIKDGVYRRWRVDIERLEWEYSEYDDSGMQAKISVGEEEPVSFVHKGGYGEEDFKEKMYFKKGGEKIYSDKKQNNKRIMYKNWIT